MREVGVRPSFRIAAAEAVQPAWARGGFSHCLPGSRTGVFVVRPLCTLALMRICRLLETVSFAGKHEFDPTLEEEIST